MRRLKTAFSMALRRRPSIPVALSLLWFTLMTGLCQAKSEAEEWASFSDTRLHHIASKAEANSDDVAPQIALGLQRYWSDDVDGAATAFEHALLRDDTAAPAHLFLAMALNLQGIEDAARHYGSAESEAETQAKRAQTTLFAAADLHFERAVSLQPDDPYAIAMWANALFERGRVNPLSIPVGNPSTVLTKYRQALELDPDHRVARSALAHALFSYGATYRYVWLDHEDSGPAIEWLPADIDGQASRYLGEAAEIYATLISLYPDDTSLYGPAIRALEVDRKFGQMIALCKLAMDRFPGSRIAHSAHRSWGGIFDSPAYESDPSTSALRAEHEDYRSRLSP